MTPLRARSFEPTREPYLSLRQATFALENVHEGVVVTDAEERIIWVNRAFLKTSGYAADEVIGLTPRILSSEDHSDAFYAEAYKKIRETGHWRGEILTRRKSGSVHPVIASVSCIRDESGRITNYVAILSDMSVINATKAQLDRLANFDALTDLPNRFLFRARLENAAERLGPFNRKLAVAILGIDGFKMLNETLGLQVGDEILTGTARRLRAIVPETHTVARLAGDEFVILLEDVAGVESAGRMVRTILDALAGPFDIGGREMYLTSSAGVSVFPDHSNDTSVLQRHAHVAFHRAKQSGRNTIQLFAAGMMESANERIRMESELRRALQKNEFILHFQPQFSLKDGSFAGVEALVRWQHPERGELQPTSFIAIAEDAGLIEDLGMWVLNEACAQMLRWREDGLPRFRVAVNLSARQIRASLVDTVAAALQRSGVEPGALELEITEGFLMREPEEALRTLTMLKQLGVTLAIDDFGTGYSSLTYLKLFPVDRLKIDYSFVRDLPRNEHDVGIARAILTLGHGLNLKVLAEGVEKEEQAEFLRAHACDEVQGFLFGSPMPAAELGAFLRRTLKGSD